MADDFVILCKTEAEATQALELVRAWMAENELTLHPEKTHVSNCLEAGQGFDFLGYRFEPGKRLARKKSLKKLKDAIRQNTQRKAGRSLRSIIGEINPVLRGWYNYFKHAVRGLFDYVDGFVRRRLRWVLLKNEGKRGAGYGHAHQRWPNAYFAERGLFTMVPAWRLFH